jgi:hypothetical protein
VQRLGEQASPPANPSPPERTPTGWHLGLDRFTLAIVASALALAVVLYLVILQQPSESRPMDESSPAGVVHNYLLALGNDEVRKAYDYLSAEAQARTPYEQFARQVAPASEASWRIRIDDERVEGDSARVTVRRTYGRGGGFFPFSSSEYTSTVVYVLTRENGAWKLAPTGPGGFYPYY